MLVPTKDLSGYTLQWAICGAAGIDRETNSSVYTHDCQGKFMEVVDEFVSDFMSMGYFDIECGDRAPALDTPVGNERVFVCWDKRRPSQLTNGWIATEGTSFTTAMLRWIAVYHYGDIVDIPDELLILNRLAGHQT